jgi:hypothetical protein
MYRVGKVLPALILGGLIIFPSAAFADDGTFSPNPATFTNVTTGNSETQTITFTNTSGADVTVTGISVDDTTNYSLAAPPSAPTPCDSNPTIPASGTCTEDVTFTPTGAGSFPATVTLSFSDATTATDAVSGTAVNPAPPPLRITRLSLSPTTFYPLVRDGYRDFTDYHVSFNEAAAGQIHIFNHKGTLTRSYAFTNRTQVAIAWGGRNGRGEKVKTGYYRFRVVAHTATSKIASGFNRVLVKTGFRTVTQTGVKAKTGLGWSSRSTGAYEAGGNCNWARLPGAQLLTTCLFAHASVTYTFELPRGAKVTSFSHHVSAGAAPCRNTSWSTSHVGRVHHATFHHGSQNGFSQCAIGGMRMSWRVRHRIRI